LQHHNKKIYLKNISTNLKALHGFYLSISEVNFQPIYNNNNFLEILLKNPGDLISSAAIMSNVLAFSLYLIPKEYEI